MSAVGNGRPAVFDVEQHRREKLRRTEQRCEWLDGYRRKLERLLGLALTVAVAGTGVEPLALLDVLDDLDDDARDDSGGLSRARLADLLGGPS